MPEVLSSWTDKSSGLVANSSLTNVIAQELDVALEALDVALVASEMMDCDWEELPVLRGGGGQGGEETCFVDPVSS